MKYFRLLAASWLLAIATLLPANGALAASNSLGVNPRRDYSIKPGDKLNDTLYISNLSTTDDLNVTIDVIDFSAKNETGAPALQLGTTQTARWSIKPFLTIPKTVKVTAGKSATIPFTLAIPNGTGGGSFYGAVRYSTSGDTTKQNVSLLSSSATLMFVRVAGAATDSLVLRSFGAFTPDASGESGAFGKFYVGSAPKYLSYRVENTGNIAEQPNGGIELKNVFGKKTSAIDKANPNSNVVLLGQTRRIDVCLNEQKVQASGGEVQKVTCNDAHLWPGRYTAKLALIYGDDGSNVSGASSHELNAVTSFWFLPAWSLIALGVIVLLLAGIVFLVVRLVTGKRRYQHRPYKRS